MIVRSPAIAASLAAIALAVVPVAAPASPNSDAVNAVAGFNPSRQDSFERLEAVIDARAADVAALGPRLRAANRTRRWAAMYVAHNLPRTSAGLRILAGRLGDGDPSIRAMAAFAVLGGGREQAIPVLIALLRSRGEMRFGEPPEPLATMANARLVRLTGANFRFNAKAGARARTRAIRAWESWWRQVRAKIRWDAVAHRFRWRARHVSGAQALANPAAPAEPAPARAASTPLAAAADYTTGSVGNEKLTVQVNVELVFDTDVSRRDRSAIARATRNAQKIYNAKRRTGQCLDVKFEVNVKTRGPTDPPTPGYHKIEINEAYYEGDPDWRRSYVRRPEAGAEGSGRWYTSEVVQYGDRLTAHEILHLMSFGDTYTRNADGSTTHHDPEDILDSGVSGDLLQNTLDEMVNRYAEPDDRKCERYALSFELWTTKLTAHEEPTRREIRHLIGEIATARVHAGFWVNPRTGRVTPAGEGISGDSEMKDVRADRGRAQCSRVSLEAGRARFRTFVTGERKGDVLSLRLDVGDRETFSYSCTPAAKPPSGSKTLVRDGMEAAGATEFTIPRPGVGNSSTKAFTYSASFVGANGTGVVRRLG